VFAKGQAKVTVYQEEDIKGLRVVLDVEYKDFGKCSVSIDLSALHGEKSSPSKILLSLNH